MKNFFFVLVTALLLCIPAVRAQVVTTEPDPLQEDSQNVVVYFHADEGNKGLINMPASTHIYAHTGVDVVDADGNTTEWKYAPEWNEDLPKYRLEYVSENLWKLNIGNIREYYGAAANETVKRLCFVFRNTGGAKAGRDVGDADIFVDVLDSGFQLAFTKTRASNILTTASSVRFTASTTVEADIKIYVNDTQVAEKCATTSLQTVYKFEKEGSYNVKAVATANGNTLERSIPILFVGDSKEASDKTVPPMGVTKNSDGSYTFCIAAPEKKSVIVIGSWDSYVGSSSQVMEYVDVVENGYSFRYFKTTIPASVTGAEFGYYYMVDGTSSVGDPYARLVLNPDNDKYIPASVYPDMPEYPAGLPANTVVTWYADNLLDYKWNVTDFKGASKDNLVIYELLLRDFTGTEGEAKGNGTVRQAIKKLDYLKNLGINAIELLPINEFNGNNSWGYNPNFYFAIDKAYGTPQDYKEFIDKCHEMGIAVILDVVFNQSDWLHPWYMMYKSGANPFFNATAPHAYSVLNDWNQGYPLVEKQWKDMLRFWLTEYNVDGFRFDLVKGLGDNTSYANNGDAATNAYNASRVARMKRLHDAMREVRPDAYFINENLAGAKEENEMAEDGELNWLNLNNAGCQTAMGYASGSGLNSMWATKASRTAGSTVAYLESHDEERLAYKQNKWGAEGVKGDHKVSMQRLGMTAAQMLLVPGSHMIWMFSEMGNAQTTKDANGGNNTSPKIVDWAALNDPDNAALVEIYQKLINMRLTHKDLFAETAGYSINFSTWAQGRTLSTSANGKELYAVMNPNVTGSIDVKVNFLQDNNSAYHVAIRSHDSSPKFDAVAKTITVEANCFAVITTTDISGVEDMEYESARTLSIQPTEGAISVSNCDGHVSVYTLQGVNVGEGEGDCVIPVEAGTYVVRAGATTAKIIVR